MKKNIIPEEKLNELAQEVSTRLLARHFFEQGKITGEGLKSFAEHQQVNKFLLFQIFQIWEMQINKLSHPYFNLENPEIQETVSLLKNQISQHISISEEEFQPLLKRAVYNNLKLLLDPEETFKRFFFAQTDKIPMEVYGRYSQFFSDMDFIVNSILRYFQKNKLDSVDKDVFFAKMKKAVEVYNKKSGQTFDQYRDAQFRALTGNTISQLDEEARKAKEEAERLIRQKEEEERRKELEARQQKEEEERKQRELELKKQEEERIKQEEERRRQEEEANKKRQQEEEERKRKSSFFDSLGSVDNFFDLDDDEEETPVETTGAEVKEEIAPVAPQNDVVKEELKEEAPVTPVVEEKPAVENKDVVLPNSNSNGNGSYVWTPVEEKKESQPKVIEDEKPKENVSNNLLDRFRDKDNDNPKEQKTSVLDMVNQRSKTIADSLGANSNTESKDEATTGKIKLDEIPIHKQYQYVQKVFEGNNVRFRIIVDKVNNASNASEIEDILKKFVLNNDKLNRDDSVVKEFIGMLQNRF
ncbi:MAG: hypothetical protein MRZ79_22450 [Bacteroidia bacterium]|nr:hypothetical protein [Bacteroidia bacterium]